MSTTKHILLVEDEMIISLDMEMTLSQLGHRVTAVATIGEALYAIADLDIDLAIIDYHLRDGDTSSLAEHLVGAKVPFIVCSGSAGLHELGEVFQTAAFLPKPFSADGLLEVVTRASATQH